MANIDNNTVTDEVTSETIETTEGSITETPPKPKLKMLKRGARPTTTAEGITTLEEVLRVTRE